MSEIKDLMIKAIEEERPEDIDKVCLPIWNQPFFFKIDKAKAITISYSPTDKGARTNYKAELEKYKKDKSSMSSEAIYDLLYNFKKEVYWRKRFDTILEALGVPDENIAHLDMSSFPYANDLFRQWYQNIDQTYKYVLDAIDILKEQLEFIIIDGKDNYKIVQKYFSNYSLIAETTIPVNKRNRSSSLKIYRNQNTVLIYFGTFLYGQTCVSNDCINKIICYVKKELNRYE